MSGNTGIRIWQVGTVAVSVTDQDRALRFYEGELGFEKRRDVPFGPGGRWIEVAPPGSATTIALIPAAMGAPAAAIQTGIRLFSHDAQADHADLRARGIDADPEIIRMDPAPPMFTLRDPDGNSLIVVEARST